MIGATHRFHGHNALRYVYQHGQTQRSPQFSLRYAANDRQAGYRVAVVVSKKVHKSAVKRNRIRRRLYAALQPHEQQLGQAYDLVFTVFDEQVADMPMPALQQLVSSQLEKAQVIGSTEPSHAIVEKAAKEE
jgi:ribonuclease P protein component